MDNSPHPDAGFRARHLSVMCSLAWAVSIFSSPYLPLVQFQEVLCYCHPQAFCHLLDFEFLLFADAYVDLGPLPQYARDVLWRHVSECSGELVQSP